ncbi:MAG: nucleotidyl transferase AbiEii/AbiGii toxin family protein [Candidatus Thermoplasmatota archaeon]
MSIFEKWEWIKRNWTYILEEASTLNLVFVGGTALNLDLFKEYRASEDIDLYDPCSKTIGTAHEEESIATLAKRLKKKGFKTKSRSEKAIYVGPNIKIEVFNDGTPFTNIQKKNVEQTTVLLFDIQTYAEMKITALLCRSEYDARDLVDVFVIQKDTGLNVSFPKRECEVIQNRFTERLEDIKNTKKEDLFVFQTVKQVDALPYDEFDEFKEWMYDWLSGFR